MSLSFSARLRPWHRLRTHVRCVVALAALVAGACGAPGAQSSAPAGQLDTTAIRASIDSLGAKVMRANETRDAELFASTWAIDGVLSYPGRQPVRGRDSIVANFRRRPPLPPGARITIHPTELQVQSPDWAYVMGVDTLRLPSADGAAPVVETSTFLVILRRTPEGWQTYREVLSRNQ